MIEADRRDDGRDRRAHDIRGVAASADPDLEKRRVGRMSREQQEGRRHRDLEEADLAARIDALAALEGLDKLVFAHELSGRALAPESHTFMEAHEMGRGVNMHG
jgi:hypothetical protein